METTLRLVGDGLTIVILSVIWGAARAIWRRTPAGTLLPAPWGGRASKVPALTTIPAIAAVVLLGLSFWGASQRDIDVASAVMLFGARALLTALFGLLHLSHLRAVLLSLNEGANEP